MSKGIWLGNSLWIDGYCAYVLVPRGRGGVSPSWPPSMWMVCESTSEGTRQKWHLIFAIWIIESEENGKNKWYNRVMGEAFEWVREWGSYFTSLIFSRAVCPYPRKRKWKMTPRSKSSVCEENLKRLTPRSLTTSCHIHLRCPDYRLLIFYVWCWARLTVCH